MEAWVAPGATAPPGDWAVSPRGGLSAWAEPFGGAQPATRFGAGEVLQVLDRRDAWVQVRCVTGWTGWVDGRLLEAPRPPTFEATDVVARTGTTAWSSPDPSGPGVALAPGVALQRRGSWGDWALVVSAEGWQGWVATGGLSSAGWALRWFGVRVHLGLLSVIGGVLVLGGSFLPWFTAAGTSVSAWDTPLRFLLVGTGSGSGETVLDAGPVLLLVGGATRPPSPWPACCAPSLAPAWAWVCWSCWSAAPWCWWTCGGPGDEPRPG
ncbi:MAG: hypothetical protein IPM45_14320 [Acidimicrobiales bacterium]|nr:hypothetical protein [Acidimicrobiales bacterium]